jgi:hypothetical protein
MSIEVISMFARLTFRPLIIFAFLTTFSFSVQSQDSALPGTEVADSEVGTDANTLVTLASQQFPDIFASATSWRLYSGIYYKFYATTGVYLGIGDGQVYVLGGQFGNEVVGVGSVASVITALGGTSSSAGTTSFTNLKSASTVNALLEYFTTLTVNYGTISSFGTITSSVTLEVQGTETIDGAATQKLIVTIAGSNVANPLTYQMWANGEGKFVKVIHNASGVEYPATSANLIGTSLISSMLLALAAADSPAYVSGINAALASPTMASQITQTTVGGVPAQTLRIETNPTDSARYVIELSDFGSFSMVTGYESTLGTTTSTMSLSNIVLR